jgi:hypothetical protein
MVKPRALRCGSSGARWTSATSTCLGRGAGSPPSRARGHARTVRRCAGHDRHGQARGSTRPQPCWSTGGPPRSRLRRLRPPGIVGARLTLQPGPAQMRATGGTASTAAAVFGWRVMGSSRCCRRQLAVLARGRPSSPPCPTGLPVSPVQPPGALQVLDRGISVSTSGHFGERHQPGGTATLTTVDSGNRRPALERC